MRKPVFNDCETELRLHLQNIAVGEKFTDDAGVVWECLYVNPYREEYRWYFIGLLVVTDGKGTSGHYFIVDKSESQDGQFEYDDYWLGPSRDFDWIPVRYRVQVVWDPA